MEKLINPTSPEGKQAAEREVALKRVRNFITKLNNREEGMAGDIEEAGGEGGILELIGRMLKPNLRLHNLNEAQLAEMESARQEIIQTARRLHSRLGTFLEQVK